MKKDDSKPEEKQVKSTTSEPTNAEQNADHPEKETMEEKAKREGWTDVLESHLGIDE